MEDLVSPQRLALCAWIILAAFFTLSLLKKQKSLRLTGALGLLVVVGFYVLVIFADIIKP